MNAGAKTPSVGAHASTAISKPQITSERVIVALAPKRSLIAPPNAATIVAAKMPAPSSNPSWASLRPKEC